MDTRIAAEQVYMVTLEATGAAGVFALASHWLSCHPDATLFGTDYDYDVGADDHPVPRPHLIRLTVVTSDGVDPPETPRSSGESRNEGGASGAAVRCG
ncbi:hypothetical protein [Amycolatopsis sp. CA-230715]|uniref:hypothetical protein n=1 Tax=Amycolatopsis sp. CA-230715 TaxID=2745196 RepID=UPI001C00D282|nr:hypothetical protein [Amycolatopsis sp. CA-230715]QWF85619.1 hypothetical protein HUW46_09074 [Amycolatopsis sp. CA-230715]